VASTIWWNEEPAEFRQSGCSPNYQADYWSLAFCKHAMRGAAIFRRRLEEEAVPLFVFTVAGRNGQAFQALVSIAKVTIYFRTMEEYAMFVCETGQERLLSSRLTRVRIEDGLLGWRFGDCHADRRARVGPPLRGHVHGGEEEWWQRDNDGTHLILFAEEYLLWKEPRFVTRQTVTQRGYGLKVTAENLGQILIGR
jgi:hypothetical protein